MVVWQLPQPIRGSRHNYKYRLACVIDGQCMLRFDHEAGKSDHYHRDGDEFPYNFVSLDRLLEGFWRSVDAYPNH